MKVSLFIIGTVVIVVGVLIIGAESFLFEWFFPIAEQYISRDHHITRVGQQHLHNAIYFVGILCLLVGGFCYGWTQSRFRSAIKQAMLTDPACNSSSTIFKPANVLILSSAIGVILSILYWGLKDYFFLDSLYQEDSFFETITAVNFLFAAFLMSMAALSKWKSTDTYIPISYLLITLVFFFIGMEEISWGQRIFGWETPLFLEEINIQDETNLHNILSRPQNVAIRGFLAILFFLILLVGWFLTHRFWPKVYNYVFPHPSLVVLAFLIVVVGLRGTTGELLEELTSFFALFYSIRVWACFRY